MTVQTAKPRTYVVTGSASGIGAATALMLRARGDRVVGVDLKNADVEADLSTAVGRCRAILDACLRHDENGARHKQSSRQRRVLVAVPGRTHQQRLQYRSGYGKTLYCTRGPVAGYWSTPSLPAQSRLR